MRAAVDAAIVEVCQHRDWKLFALNVRTNHVHVAVAATATSEKMLHDFKAYATRRLRRNGLVGADTHVWTAKGRVKGIDNPDGLATLIDYILNRQGPL
jgi:REP element-mobilizing transposase RayT